MTEVITSAFLELDALLEKEQYRLAVKKADEILKLEKGDVDALRSKVFALIKRNKFEDIVSASQGVADHEVKFCRSYALYRLGKLPEALEIAKGLKLDEERVLLELKGQIFYKQGKFPAAKNAFEQLLRDFGAVSMEIKANFLASMAASRHSERVEELCEKYKITLEDGFETVFNKACNFVELKQYEKSQELVELALREGQETLLEEEWTEDEVKIELLPLSLQLQYIKLATGSLEDPTKDLTEASNSKGISLSTKSVVENNLISMKSRKFPDQPSKRMLYESAKKLEKMSTASSVPLLSPSQSITVRCNQALLLMGLNHMEDATSVLEKVQYEDPGKDQVKMTRAVWLAKHNKTREAIELLDEIKTSDGSFFLGPLLFKAQLLCTGGSPKDTLRLLVEIEDASIRFKGSMVATKIALMEQIADYNGCCEVLEAALEWWKQNDSTEKTKAIAWILEKFASIKIKQGDLKTAVEYCKEALETETDDLRRMTLLAKLSRLLTLTEMENEDLLNQHFAEGPPVSKEDVDALEGNINGSKRGEDLLKKKPAADGQAKKRKRRPRYPKGFDPENPGPKPDPERWLPKWQRSGYRKRSQRKKEAVKGSQGAGKVDESLDRRLNPSEPSASKPSKAPNRSGHRSKGGRR